MPLNILVVDDSSIVRKILSRVLGMVDIPINNIFEASNGVEGLKILNRYKVDLVFSDREMPEMDGSEMLKKMKEEGYLDTIPVIMISLEGRNEYINELMEMGAKGYIKKPFTPRQVVECLNSVFPEKTIMYNNYDKYEIME